MLKLKSNPISHFSFHLSNLRYLFSHFSIILILFSVLIHATSCKNFAQENRSQESTINGVCLVAPRKQAELAELSALQRIAPNFVAVTPFAYQREGESKLNFFEKNPHWWGEGIEGCRETIKQLHVQGFKVMLKPHVWVVGEGWPGDFRPAEKLEQVERDRQWKIWEASYRAYILALTQVAVEEAVEIFCIGTEYRYAVRERADFWKSLIVEVKAQFEGKLVYAANWDNYQSINFWSRLDFIGIDAYFPLSDAKEPALNELKSSWKPLKTEILTYAKEKNKPILFTEFGYRSIPYTSRGNWQNDDVKEISESAQETAYQALFESWWEEPSFAGGFLWKWFPADSSYRLHEASGRFSPQGKSVEELIYKQYQ